VLRALQPDPDRLSGPGGTDVDTRSPVGADLPARDRLVTATTRQESAMATESLFIDINETPHSAEAPVASVVDVAEGPYGIALSPDDKCLYAAHVGAAHVVSVIDL
jgi:DNA-binding beta-propeller fold protein YncE